MMDTCGHLFWAGPEATILLDSHFALGKAKEPTVSKVDIRRLLEAQNGGIYGPITFKGQPKPIVVPRTNVSFLHVGQPQNIQNY